MKCLIMTIMAMHKYGGKFNMQSVDRTDRTY